MNATGDEGMEEERKLILRCASCPYKKGARECDSEEGKGPEGCPTLYGADALGEAEQTNQDPSIRNLARQSAIQEAEGYAERRTDPRAFKTRIEETCELLQRMNAVKVGLAFCAGLIREARTLERILTIKGFEVYSVVCKVGNVPKERFGLLDHQKIHPGRIESACNPIAQAEFLNEAATDFNIMMGLCVGHDALFLKHVKAWTTVIAVKDRVLGHNPLAALYTSGSYYKRLLRKT